MFDAIIVGGRCSGSPLAMRLARSGHRVLVVDRATFPSDTMSTHFIQSPGMHRLDRWGLMDRVFETNCPPIKTAYFDIAGEAMEFDIPLHAPLPGLACPRRTVLDKILLDAAVSAGAEIAEGVFVDSLLRDGERVVGVKGHTSEGAFEERARLVVGADGRHSVVARETEAPFVRYVEPLDSGYYSYFRSTGVDDTETFFHDDLTCVIFPTNDDLTTVAVVWPRDRFPELRKDIAGHFDTALQRLGGHVERVRGSERVEPFTGSADLANYIRKAAGPGWALVGDACYHKDPIAADGISDAFRGADLLADALHGFLSGESDERTALDDYERHQTAYLDKHFDAAVRCANLELTPQERSGAFFERRLNDEEEVLTLL